MHTNAVSMESLPIYDNQKFHMVIRLMINLLLHVDTTTALTNNGLSAIRMYTWLHGLNPTEWLQTEKKNTDANDVTNTSYAITTYGLSKLWSIVLLLYAFLVMKPRMPQKHTSSEAWGNL